MSVKLFHPGASHDLSFAAQSIPQSDAVAVAPLCSARIVWLCRGLCLTGLGISLYLAWSALQMQPVAGCGGSGVVNCEHVLGSEWSKVAGMPVSIPAAALYGSLLSLLSFARRPAPAALQKLLWQFLTAGFLTAGFAAVWFISIQIGVLQHICPWCMGAHTCSLLLAGIALFKAPVTAAIRQQSAAIALLAAGFLAAVQLGTEPPEPVVIPAADPPADAADGELFAPPAEPEVFAPPTAALTPAHGRMSALFASVAPLQAVESSLLPLAALRSGFFRPSTTAALFVSGDESSGQDETPAVAPSPRMVTISMGGIRGSVQLQVGAWPMLGPETAETVFVEMFDYTCPHCRANHRSITAAMKAVGNNAAMIALPVPLNQQCNSATSSNTAGACELGELAIAVWRCDKSKFATYHDWLMAAVRTPSAADAQAAVLVGRAKLDTELQTGMAKKFIQQHVALYRKAGAGVVPKLLFSDSVVEGQVQAAWLQNRLQQLPTVSQVPSNQTQVSTDPAVAVQPALQSQSGRRRRK